jgi:outer membrane protein assembly factor BamB
MEVWWIAPNGSVQDAYWYDGQPWQQFELAPAGSASVTGGIAAVSRIPNSMEVWWVAPDGSVQDAYWYDGQPWQRFQLAPAGSASLQGGIAAVSRVANSMEVWWVGSNGSVQDAYWYDGQPWQRFQLAPAGSVSLQGGIAAVSRIPTSMEVWWVGSNGSVQDAYWYDGQPWQRFELAPAGSAAVQGGIAAVSRIQTSMEVWWVGSNGSVQDAYWYDGQLWKRFELAPAGSGSLRAGITAVSRIPASMEVWWIAPNGSVQDAYWYHGQPWNRFELVSAGSASPNVGMASTSRIPESMEIWWIGADGSIRDAYWYAVLSNEWYAYRRDSARSGVQPYASNISDPAKVASLSIKWSFPAAGPPVGAFRASPIVVYDTVFIGGADSGYFYALDAASGGLKWQYPRASNPPLLGSDALWRYGIQSSAFYWDRRGARTASVKGKIAAASRIPSTMEVWWIAPNGSVQDAYWYDSQPWQQFELAPAGSASPEGGIAAVSRIPNSMELWWIAPDGSVQDAYWYDGHPWQRFELAPAGSAAVQSGIDAVSRISNSMEVWWMAPNGAVQDAYWYDGQPWKRFELAPAGSAAVQGGIAAVSRIPTSMEVWWAALDGSVQDAFWYDGQPWQRFELAPAGSAAVEGGIAVVSRIPTSMEVWWAAPNGSVQDAFWYDGQPWKRFELAPAGSVSVRGGITARSRISTSMEVWWIAPNGSVQDAYWYDGQPWKQFELAPAGSASPNAGMASTSRIPGSMEIWWISADGAMQDAYWYDGQPWSRFDLPPDAVIVGAQDPSLGPLGSGARLFALDAKSGAEIWKSEPVATVNGDTTADQTNPPPPASLTELHQRIAFSSPLIFNNKIYVGIHDTRDDPIQTGRVIAVDLGTGRIDHSFQFQSVGTSASPPTVRGGGVWNALAADGTGVYFTTGNTRIPWCVYPYFGPSCPGPFQPEPSPNHGLSLLRVDKDTGNINWAFQPVPFTRDGDPDWAAGATVMSTSCGELIASVQKDGWSYAVNAGNGSLRWQFPPTGFGPAFLNAVHGDDDYRRPGAAWNDVFIIRTGGETVAAPGHIARGYDKLHALNACATTEPDRVRWIADIPNIMEGHTSYSTPTVTGGIVFIGTNKNPMDNKGHLVVLGDPSVVPAVGWRCSNTDYSSSACPAPYVLVPIPRPLANVVMPDGGGLAAMRNEPVLAKGRVFVATSAGHVYMLEP